MESNARRYNEEIEKIERDFKTARRVFILLLLFWAGLICGVLSLAPLLPF